MICKNLDRSDLKNARLARKEFNDAAEEPLFRHIYLRRIMDSFCRLRMIASTPFLANLVKGIVYSGQMLWVKQYAKHPDFNQWRRVYFGQGFRPARHEVSDETLNSCTTADLHRYYSNWCGHLHSQRLMRRYDIEGRDLDDAFGKLPRLEEICFGSGNGYRKRYERITPELFGSLGREMLVEPNLLGGLEYHIGQFRAMMAAAHKNKKNLKVIKAFHLPRRVFLQPPGVLAMMTGTMRSCEYVTLDVWKYIYEEKGNNGDLQIGSMIRNSPHLRKLELTFCMSIEDTPELARLFLLQSYWPNLESLQLQGFSTSSIHFKKILAAHATSLKSLDLGFLNLRPYESKGKLQHSSWVRMIMFLRDSLSLREMRFHHDLTNEGSENWIIENSTAEYGQGKVPTGKKLTVKDGVQRYVVEGGEFPLPWPTEAGDESCWRDMLLAFQPRLDETWKYCEGKRLLTL